MPSTAVPALLTRPQSGTPGNLASAAVTNRSIASGAPTSASIQANSVPWAASIAASSSEWDWLQAAT